MPETRAHRRRCSPMVLLRLALACAVAVAMVVSRLVEPGSGRDRGTRREMIDAMSWTAVATDDEEPLIAGRRVGSGPPILLLHGGPSLSFEYLSALAEELAVENDVVWYQQRGLAPSATGAPYSVAADVDDARRILDALGWEKAYVVGHSWGGHLALHVAEGLPERVLGVLAVDPLGSVGDGRWPEFDQELFRRTPEAVRERARELDELTTQGTADEELALEGLRLVACGL